MVSALIDALAPTPEDALAVVCAVGPVVADVIRVVSVRGTRAPMLRVWRGTVPFVVRGQSERLLCSVPDKAFRAAIASSLTDDGFITAISGDYDTQARWVYVAFWTVAKSLSQGQPYIVEATSSELQLLKAAERIERVLSNTDPAHARAVLATTWWCIAQELENVEPGTLLRLFGETHEEACGEEEDEE